MRVKNFIGTKIKNFQCNVVAKSLSFGFWFGVVALARNSSFIFFQRWHFALAKKLNVLFARWLF